MAGYRQRERARLRPHAFIAYESEEIKRHGMCGRFHTKAWFTRGLPSCRGCVSSAAQTVLVEV